jgi:hypothetical protein
MFACSLLLGGLPLVQHLKYLGVSQPECSFYHKYEIVKHLLCFCSVWVWASNLCGQLPTSLAWKCSLLGDNLPWEVEFHAIGQLVRIDLLFLIWKK